jgi:hypothetical protein
MALPSEFILFFRPCMMSQSRRMMSHASVRRSSRARLNFFAEKRDENNEIIDQIYVFYSPEPSVGMKTMRT